ncbi:hypothetical protein [Mitsuokella jalaludinii]|uniref:hypothetical protein n=1 Tax=Mitsuokella jalaludinii TaxID=187979 RepID=UPI00138DEA8B|nr:hypothetical protein [Mitsuokella jalaludinii]
MLLTNAGDPAIIETSARGNGAPKNQVPDSSGLSCSLAGTLSVEIPKTNSGQEWTKASGGHEKPHRGSCRWTPFAFGPDSAAGEWNGKSYYIFQALQSF